MSDNEMMGRNEYAKHRGCSASAVSKAAKDGRISRAVTWKDGQIKAIKWRLADELWKRNTDPSRVPFPAQASPAVQTSRPAAGAFQVALGQALASGFVAWAGLIVHRHALDAERAASLIADLHLVQAAAIAIHAGGDPERDQALIAGELKAYLSLEERPALLDRIRAAAQSFAENQTAEQEP